MGSLIFEMGGVPFWGCPVWIGGLILGCGGGVPFWGWGFSFRVGSVWMEGGPILGSEGGPFWGRGCPIWMGRPIWMRGPILEAGESHFGVGVPIRGGVHLDGGGPILGAVPF